jgi:4-amino-4-deoxy-L-arabinose transferase-like glycosyltransferase
MPGSDAPPPENRWLWRGLATALILASAGLHVAYLVRNCPLDLAPDEAHYWDWSRHLDWSYYSKGPLVALLIRGSCELFGPLSQRLTGNLALAIRLPAIVCGVLLLASMYILAARVLGREQPAFALVALMLTLPPIAALSTLMTIDAPYTACWGWALVFGYEAAVRGRRWAWPVAGLVVGVGILAKYTMVLWVPSVGLFLLTSPAHRRELARPGFWIACVIAGLFAVPIVLWNAGHGWVTFRHVGWQAGVEERDGWRWLGPLTFVAGQVGVLLGVWFVAWVAALWQNRPWRETDPGRRYLWWLAVPTFAVFLAASLRTPVQINWAVAAYLSGGVLVAAWSENRWRISSHSRKQLLAPTFAAVLGIAVTVAVHYPGVGRPLLVAVAGRPTADRPFPLRRVDPTVRLRGWRTTLAAAVDETLTRLHAEGDDPIIAGTVWNLPGLVGVYADGHPAVYSVGLALGDRLCQYDLWRPNPVWDPDAFHGRTFLLVGQLTPAVYDAFAVVEPPREVRHVEAGQPVAAWTLTVCRGYRGFGPVEQFLKSAHH